MESGEGMGGGVECGEGLGVQAVMRDGAVHSGAGNEGWLRDGAGVGVLVFICEIGRTQTTDKGCILGRTVLYLYDLNEHEHATVKA